MAASPPVRTGRDPAVVIWVVSGACWILTAGLVLAGASASCRDEAMASGGVPEPPPVQAATAFAAWKVMAGANNHKNKKTNA